MEFAIGVCAGFALAALLSWLAVRYEWNERRGINNRLKYLERNLCCGKGVFGCKQGPRCDWEHK